MSCRGWNGGGDRAGLSPGRGSGRPPVGVERMLRLHGLHQWVNLSDPAVEEALDDSRARRHFVGIDLGRANRCRMRRRAANFAICGKPPGGEQLFARSGEHWVKHGVQVRRGTLVDAPIIAAPRSTKNRMKAREPARHQTKKGTPWYFGMKAHRGGDSRPKRIPAVAATSANGHDSPVWPELLPGQEPRGWGDAASSGQRDVIRHHAPGAQHCIQTNAHRQRPLREGERARNRTKSKVRAQGEPVFLVIKRIFGWANVRDRGLAKNTHWLSISCGLANLYVARRRVWAGA